MLACLQLTACQWWELAIETLERRWYCSFHLTEMRCLWRCDPVVCPITSPQGGFRFKSLVGTFPMSYMHVSLWLRGFAPQTLPRSKDAQLRLSGKLCVCRRERKCLSMSLCGLCDKMANCPGWKPAFVLRHLGLTTATPASPQHRWCCDSK